MPKSAAEPRVTLSSVAEAAGVSLATISKVLNGRPDVSADTRKRVEALLAEHGYERHSRANRSRGHLIELVLHDVNDPWSTELIAGVEQAAREQGLAVAITTGGTRQEPDPEWIEGVLRRRPAGVVLALSDLAPDLRAQLESRAIPYIFVDPAGDPAPDVPSVGSANWSGGLQATRHLLELGHTRIAAITGPSTMLCSLARLDGYRTAMTAVGLPFASELIRFGDFGVGAGRQHGTALLGQAEPPTAIFAGSDLQALGVYEAARSLGVSVPEQLSVVGYDDLPAASWMSPPLTTVHQPLRRMGAEAAQIVLGMSRRRPSSTPRLDLATHLVVRESTAPPPQ